MRSELGCSILYVRDRINCAWMECVHCRCWHCSKVNFVLKPCIISDCLALLSTEGGMWGLWPGYNVVYFSLKLHQFYCVISCVCACVCWTWRSLIHLLTGKLVRCVCFPSTEIAHRQTMPNFLQGCWGCVCGTTLRTKSSPQTSTYL